MKKSVALALVLIFSATICVEYGYSQGRPKYSSNKSMSRYKGSNKGYRINPKYMYHVFGASVNSMNYFGDLSPINRAASTDVSFTQPGLGITYGYHFSSWLTSRIGFNYGRIAGDDFNSADPTNYQSLTRYTRNVHFRNDIKEFSIGFELDLIPNYKGVYSRPPMTPFIFFGGAVLHHEPMAIAPERAPNGNPLAEAGQWVKLRPLGTEGQYSDQVDIQPYSNIVYAIPLGVGVKLRLPNNFNAVLEFGYRYVFSDYLDDVSGWYVDLGKINGDLAKAMSDRSAEAVSARTGLPRDFALIAEAGIGSPSTYVSRIDGQTYRVIPGFGNDGEIRGSSSKDIYVVTQLRICYLVPKMGGPKGR